ncbi:MAG: hypothetical protein ACM3ST_16575, partial [Bdellovibrio bacteriovorus]
LSWRGHALPVARLAPAPAAGAPPATLVVCLAPGAHGTLPYLALESPRLPHLEPVGPSDLTPETETPEGAPWFVRSPLRIKGNAAWMLDLEAVEGRLLR